MFLAAIGTVRTHVQTPFDGFSSGSSMLAAVLMIAWRQLINSSGRIRILSTDYHMSMNPVILSLQFFLKGIPNFDIEHNKRRGKFLLQMHCFFNSWEITR